MSGTTSFRSAERSECRAIATLYRISSDGLADYIWTKLAAPEEDILDVGQRRYEQEDLVFSYKNCVIVTHDEKIIGMLVAFPMEIESGVNDLEENPVLVPYSKLEEANSYYIWEMALVPEYRNQGIGRKPLALAEDKAREMSYEKLSLIVFEQNEGALKLYKRHGFKEVAREPVVPHPLIRHTGGVLLMVKAIH
jgi:ribosomal protein S18 acetylase RimI-like enzyme